MEFSYDERRDIAVPGDFQQTLHFSLHHFHALSQAAIEDHGFFAVALSGGSTPKVLYQHLAKSPWKEKIDWERVRLFWSDERAVAADDPESNFHMAMEAGLSRLPIPKEMIFRMQAESEIEENAKRYEWLLEENTYNNSLDLVMLGMGEDGHTASLFPRTHGLAAKNRTVVSNYIPEKKTWRMTLTFDAIDSAKHSAIYVMGASKAPMVHFVFTSSFDPINYPVQRIGTKTHKALWIADREAASVLLQSSQSLL